MYQQLARIMAIAALMLITAAGSFQGLRLVMADSGARRYEQLPALLGISTELRGDAAPVLEARRNISIPYAVDWQALDEAPVLEARRPISTSLALAWTGS